MAYLDHAATTPMLPQAVDLMSELLGQVGNASSLHATGRRARRVVEESRETIAAALGARPSEVIFTSGGTESNNLALKGLFWSQASPGSAAAQGPRQCCRAPRRARPSDVAGRPRGRRARGASGRRDRSALAATCSRAELERSAAEVALVSVMWANNEVGTVQPIAMLGAVATEYGVALHTDAVQAVGALPVDFAGSGVAAMTVTGHKVGGPVGVGALCSAAMSTRCRCFTAAARSATCGPGPWTSRESPRSHSRSSSPSKEQPDRAERLATMRDDLVTQVVGVVPDAQLNGDPDRSLDHRLPGIAHFSFPGCEGDALLMLLDAHGVECSTGSACSAGVARPSHVLARDGSRRGSSEVLAAIQPRTLVDGRGDLALVDAIGPAVNRARSARRTQQ